MSSLIAAAFLVIGFVLGQFGVRKLVQNLASRKRDYYCTVDLVTNCIVAILGIGCYCWSASKMPDIIPMKHPVVVTLPLWSCGVLGVIFCLRYVDRNKNDENTEAFKIMGYSIALLAVGLIGTCVEAELIILGIALSLSVIVGGIFFPVANKNNDAGNNDLDLDPWHTQAGP